MSKTIYRIVHRTDIDCGDSAEHVAMAMRVNIKEREKFYDVGIWTRSLVPAAVVVPGQVLLDRHPGAPHRGCDTPVQLQIQAGTFPQLRRAASSAFRLRDTEPEVCTRRDRCYDL